MKTVRLLPIVIFAAAALLLFKGVGLVTQGGYVLVGSTAVMAAGGGGGHGGGGGAAEGEGGEATLSEHAVTDAAPTLDDSSPTMPGTPVPVVGETEVAAPAPVEAEAAAVACVPVGVDIPAGSGGVQCEPPVQIPTTPEGDALPMSQTAEGQLVPFSTGTGSEAAVIERLGERRTELEAREQELETRMALLDAAEQRLKEKTAVLEQLQTRIDGLVDQNGAAEDEQFKGLVAMYEAMKPKQAAAILSELDLNTLLRLARGISPRKMAPILAAMDPKKAKDLTAAMAMMPVEPTVAITDEDIANLPQIVGQ